MRFLPGCNGSALGSRAAQLVGINIVHALVGARNVVVDHTPVGPPTRITVLASIAPNSVVAWATACVPKADFAT